MVIFKVSCFFCVISGGFIIVGFLKAIKAKTPTIGMLYFSDLMIFIFEIFYRFKILYSFFCSCNAYKNALSTISISSGILLWLILSASSDIWQTDNFTFEFAAQLINFL